MDQGKTTDPINVRDFGAKGDGATDDTAAINAAFAVMRRSVILTDQARPTDSGGASHLRATCPEVFFPNGLYLVSDEINIAGTYRTLRDRDMGAESIRGDHAIIKQTSPGKDIFVSGYSALTHVSGLKFVDGRNQIWLDNPNIGAVFKVSDCEFHGASGTAVIFGHHCPSTSVVLTQCLFRDCEQFVYTMTDVTMMRDLNVGGCHSRAGNNAGFDLRGGFVTFDNVMCTPWSEGHDQRWIDNRACILKLTNCRFGGEDGGILTVRNLTKYSTDIACANSIIIENCVLYNQTNLKRQAIIYCEEIPNLIMVRSTITAGIPALIVDPKIDLANYFEGVEPNVLDYAVEHCSGVRGDLPELLKHPVIKPKAVAFLTKEEIKARLDRATVFVRNYTRKHPAAALAVDAGHREQTDPAKYLDISFGKFRWGYEGFADSELVPNEKYHVVAPVDDDVLIMQASASAGNAWTLVKDVTIDLDRYPYLTYRLKPAEIAVDQMPMLDATASADTTAWPSVGVGTEFKPAQTAVNIIGAIRVLDTQSGDVLLWNCYSLDELLYRAHNLREFFGGGVKTLDIRLYTPSARVERRPPAQAADGKKPAPPAEVLVKPGIGEYTVIDFLRAEAE